MAKTARDFFTAEQQEDIKQAILNAELDTSGEIRVHIEKKCPGDVMERAALLFEKLNMHKTELRNGVMFYVAVENRKFAVIGDKGINSIVPDNFWDDVKQVLLNYFREEKFTEGLTEGILMVGQKLKKDFPHQSNDINELSDEISFE